MDSASLNSHNSVTEKTNDNIIFSSLPTVTVNTGTTNTTYSSETQSYNRFELGYKEKVTTKHDNPRERKPKLSKNDMTTLEELGKAMGSIELAISTVNSFKTLNATSPSIADGIAYQIMKTYPCLSVKVILNVFGIGMHRYYRISKGQEKQDPGGLNGSQVTTNELKTLSEFINGLPVELGFPCVHRRILKTMSME